MCGKMLCQCGCGEEVKSGNKYINGHYWIGKKHSEETKKKMSESKRGQQTFLGYIHSEETKKKMSKSHLGRKLSKETKKRMSESKKGSKHPNFQHGKKYILRQHKQHKKEECLFNCESEYYCLHHKPEIENIFNWEGRLINLCRKCHKKVHNKTLKLPEEAGIEWTLRDTEKLLRGGVICLLNFPER
jgi:hypothetical protein